MSTSAIASTTSTRAEYDQLRVVLCGSFRRDKDGLAKAFGELRKNYSVLSPASLGFIDTDADFVRLTTELHESVADIESRHLAAISEADFVWLHAPDGYVGPSATLEIGHARGLGIPVFTSTRPTDQTLAAFVEVVDDSTRVCDVLEADPGVGLAALQSYYRRIAERRGWSSESPRDILLLITEEVGELARAVRKFEGIARDSGYEGIEAEQELADVQLYLLHLANSLGINMASAVSAKEKVNSARHELATSAA